MGRPKQLLVQGLRAPKSRRSGPSKVSSPGSAFWDGANEANPKPRLTSCRQRDNVQIAPFSPVKPTHLSEAGCQARRCRFCVAGLPHIPFAVGFGRSCPSQTCPQTIQCAPRDTSSEPEAEGELPPSVPAVYEALTDVT